MYIILWLLLLFITLFLLMLFLKVVASCCSCYTITFSCNHFKQLPCSDSISYLYFFFFSIYLLFFSRYSSWRLIGLGIPRFSAYFCWLTLVGFFFNHLGVGMAYHLASADELDCSGWLFNNTKVCGTFVSSL